MKIRKEVQIGLVVLFALGCLYMGLLYLKTSHLFHNDKVVYAYYSNSEGITPSTYIYAKGYNIGRVQKIEAVDPLLSRFLFHISLNKNIRIPKDSYLNIKSSLIGGSSIILELGKMDTAFFETGDTIPMMSVGLFRSGSDGEEDNRRITAEDMMNKMDIIADSLAMLMGSVNYLIRYSIQPYLGTVMSNTAQLTHHVTEIMQKLTYANKSIYKTINNIEDFSAHLNDQSQQIKYLVNNLSSFSENLKTLPIQTWDTQITSTLKHLYKAMAQVNKVSMHLSDTTSTAGLFLNKPSLYNNLNATSQSLNLLLLDIKENPKRYVSIQIFGNRKKKKKAPSPADATGKNHQ